MQKLSINLENCYGIKKLSKVLDFSEQRTFAIYAANGVMKTSLANTFFDLSSLAALVIFTNNGHHIL